MRVDQGQSEKRARNPKKDIIQEYARIGLRELGTTKLGATGIA